MTNAQISIVVAIAVVGLAVISVEIWAAVLIIRKREPISVIKDMNATIAEMSVRLREAEARQEASHRQILKLESAAIELDRGIKILIEQLRKLNEVPDYTAITPPLKEIVSEAAALALEAGAKATLQRKIARRFSMEEIDDLAFQLGIEEGTLPGNTKIEKSTAIVQYMDRRKELNKLIEMCEELRPQEAW